MIRSIHQGNVPPGVEDLLERTVHELATLRGVRHAVVGIEPGDGAYGWIGAAGTADPAGTPMTPDTPYCLTSVTKLYIGAAILRLQERGQLSIDDPLARHLPEHLVSGLHRRRGVDRTRDLTLRHLLGHASGLPDYLFEAPKGNKALLRRVVEEGDRSWELADVIEIVRAAREAHFDPRPFDGRRHTVRYSDTNFRLLIAVIEAVTRQPIHEAFATLICEPLGLTRTWHPGTPPEAAMPPAAALWVGDNPLHRPLALRASGDICSTAGDTLRFMRALITGELFDHPATAASMRQHWNPLGFALIPTSPGWPIEYGLAMMRVQTPRLLKPLLSMPTLVGHTGSSGAWLFYARDLDIYITGTVDQFTAPAVPFRKVPRLLQRIRSITGTRPK